jgi:hypothetical protein
LQISKGKAENLFSEYSFITTALFTIGGRSPNDNKTSNSFNLRASGKLSGENAYPPVAFAIANKLLFFDPSVKIPQTHLKLQEK